MIFLIDSKTLEFTASPNENNKKQNMTNKDIQKEERSTSSGLKFGCMGT